MYKYYALKDILKELGLEAIFDGCIYDRLTDEEMVAGSIYHKTAIKNDENGTEAAAVTMALMEAMALLPEDDIVEMNMDHPFYFTISNTQTEMYIGHSFSLEIFLVQNVRLPFVSLPLSLIFPVLYFLFCFFGEHSLLVMTWCHLFVSFEDAVKVT